MKPENRWYLCSLQDTSVTAVEEPDWSRVPEAKREQVRNTWLAKQKPVTEKVYLWGPQIEFFQSLDYYRVQVLE